MKLRIFLLALSAILLAAHFLRTFSISLSAPFILFIKKRWSLLAVQALTVVAATIWLFTLQGIIQLRIQEGRSWTASQAKWSRSIVPKCLDKIFHILN